MATRTMERPSTQRPDGAGQDRWRRGRRTRLLTGAGILVVVAFLSGLTLGATGSRVDRSAGPSAFSARVLRAGATPVAYPHTREGAIAAAGNFAATIESSAIHGGPAAVRQIAAPGREADLEKAAADAQRSVLQLASGGTFGGPYLVRFMPGMWRAAQFSADEAKVDVFGSALVAGPGVKNPVAFWVTDRITLRWIGDWRLVDYGIVPSPSIAGDNRNFPDTSPDVMRALQGFEPFDLLGPRPEAGAGQ
jgi:hypothetical protein